MLNIDNQNTRQIFRSILRAIFLIEGFGVCRAEAAQRLNIQPQQLTQILSKERTTFSKEKTSMVISRAKFMLESTNLPIAEVAKELNILQVSFSNLFKKETGFTPREWRNKIKSERKVDTKGLTFQW